MRPHCVPCALHRNGFWLSVCIAKVIDTFNSGSPHNRGWPLKGLSRVMGNYLARFLGGLGPVMAPGYPVYQVPESSEIPQYHITKR